MRWKRWPIKSRAKSPWLRGLSKTKRSRSPSSIMDLEFLAILSANCLAHSFQTKTTAWDWGCRFRARLSKRTRVDGWRSRIPGAEPFFALPFRPAEWQMAAERTVYVLDDDRAVLRSLERLLSSANFEPITFDHPDTFLKAAKRFKTGCVLLDVRLPGISGLDVQAQLLKMRNDLAVIVVTGQGDVQTAVRAMKAGATDFLSN